MEARHLVNQRKHKHLHGNGTLHVIGVVSNPVAWHARYRLAREWIKEMEATNNVKVYVAECAYGNRKFEVTDPCNPHHLQVRSRSEIWLKENLINLAIKRLLPLDWEYVAWVDMDVSFRDPNWAIGTVHALQHFHIVQPWSQAVDLNHEGGIHGTYNSFGYLHTEDKPMWKSKNEPGYSYAHTGFAWACTRYFYENVKELLEFCIVGAGDFHMAWACVNKVGWAVHPKVIPDYLDMCQDWQAKAYRACSGMVGYVKGRIEHAHHGPKEMRKYWDRWSIILDSKFNPKYDLGYTAEGVMKVVGANKKQIERYVMRYNRQRIEDSIEQY